MALNFSKTKVLEVRDEAKLNAIGPSARKERTGRVCVRQSRVEHGAVGSNTKLLMCEVNKFEAELQERFFTLRVDRLISKTKFEAELNYNDKIEPKGEQRQDFSMFDHNSGINYSNAIRRNGKALEVRDEAEINPIGLNAYKERAGKVHEQQNWADRDTVGYNARVLLFMEKKLKTETDINRYNFKVLTCMKTKLGCVINKEKAGKRHIKVIGMLDFLDKIIGKGGEDETSK